MIFDWAWKIIKAVIYLNENLLNFRWVKTTMQTTSQRDKLRSRNPAEVVYDLRRA
jgi:hypothetical protein